MKFYIKRPLVTISSAFIASLALSAYINASIRITVIFMGLTLAAISVITYIIIAKLRGFPFNRIKPLFMACIIFSLIGLIIPFFMFNFKNKDFDKYNGSTVKIEAVVNKVSSESSSYASFYADVTEIDGRKADFGIYMFTSFSPQLSVGDIFICDAALTSAKQNRYFSKLYLKSNNILFDATCKDADKFNIIGHENDFLASFDFLNRETGYKFDRILSKDSAALAKALILGNKDSLNSSSERDFRDIGISHLLALSGMHLALFTAMIMTSSKYLILNRKARFIICALIALFIMIFTGATASVVRAALMVIFYQIGNLLKAQHDLLTTLFAATFFILIFNPYLILDAGLILSFAATFAIVLLSPSIRELSLKFFKNPTKINMWQRLLKFALESVCISFAAGIFVNAASIFLFDRISLITILTTLIFTPLIIGFIIFSVFALIFSDIPFLSKLFCMLTEIFKDVIMGATAHFSRFESITVSTNDFLLVLFATVFIVGFSYIVIKNKNVKIFVAFSLITQLIFFSGTLIKTALQSNIIKLIYLQDASNEGLLITSRKENVLIDSSYGTQNFSAANLTALKSSGAVKIDKLILTHYHKNHILHIRRILNSYLIREIYLPTPTSDIDLSYALDINEVCESYGINAIVYEPFEKANTVNSVEFSAFPYERRHNTSHPKSAFKLEHDEYTIIFSYGYDSDCAYFNTYIDEVNCADSLFIGNHGANNPEYDCDVPIITPTDSGITTLFTFTD